MAESEHPVPGLPIEPGAPQKRNGSTLICTKDPEGFTISLDVHRWEDHIVKRHPEMRHHLERVKGTIEDPQVIMGSTGSATTYYYKLTGRSALNADDLYILVVVARNEESRSGTVRTAHLLKNIKMDGSRILWLKKGNQ